MTDERPLNPVLSKSLQNLNQNLENVSKLLSLLLSSVSRVVASFHLKVAQPEPSSLSTPANEAGAPRPVTSAGQSEKLSVWYIICAEL